MIERPDLVHEDAPKGVSVWQLTDEPEVPSSHVYMEAQIFHPDNRRFVLHRSAHAHGSDKNDPEHRYLVCDLEDGGSFSPITIETGTTGPSLSSDGEWLYYFVNETELGSGKLTLKRVHLDGTERQTITVVDAPIRGTSFRPSRIYPLSTISSDGKRIAISAFLSDGARGDIPFGLMVFDITTGEVRVPLYGWTWGNMHAQYCRSTNPQASHDILVQEDHDRRYRPDGVQVDTVDELGIEIHVISDDGTSFRNLPWGRDGNEHCQGHQCWIGRSTDCITSTFCNVPKEHQLIAGKALPFAGHIGRCTPGSKAVRNELSRIKPGCHFYHFATDIAGDRFIVDNNVNHPERQAVYVAQLPQDGISPLQGLTPVANPKCSMVKGAHVHPFLSPDGTKGFFNSDESGILQTYMVTGW